MHAEKFKIAIVGTLLYSLLSLCVNALFEGTVAPAHARKDRDQARHKADERDLERLRRIMIPLLQATNHPERLNQARVKIVADPNINAGSAGEGEFLITTGLLQKANDEQLRGILAHEIAHDDLGHPVKMQLVGTGLTLGAALLEKVVPASGAIAPIAGTLIAMSYSPGVGSRPPWRDDPPPRWIFEGRYDSCARLDHANSRKQRRRIFVDPPSNRRAHSGAQMTVA